MIGAVIPTRGDRSVFLNKCFEMVDYQTTPIDTICVVNEKPKSEEKDITYRYRKGLEKLFSRGCEVVFLIEDDDWYSRTYAQTMYSKWLQFGKPQIFGVGETIYYHLNKRSHSKMIHPLRSSAFSTMVTKDVLNIDWPADNESFLDLELWKQLNGKTFIPFSPICMGIKHGMGVCGGRAHGNDFRYQHQDSDFSYLKKITGPESKYYTDLLAHNIV